MGETKKNIFEKIRTNKKIQIFIIIVFAVVLILTLLLSYSKDESVDNANNEISNYVKTLEEKLTKALSSVEGVGKVSAVITVESGMETVIAMKTVTTESSNGKVIEETPVLVNGKTVVLKEAYPKIIGVLLVAEGADNIATVYKIQQATVSLLDIDQNQIEILSMK